LKTETGVSNSRCMKRKGKPARKESSLPWKGDVKFLEKAH